MERTIETKGRSYKITGEWELSGIKYIFNGQLIPVDEKDSTESIKYVLPIAAVKNHGIEMFENDIVVSIMEELEGT